MKVRYSWHEIFAGLAAVIVVLAILYRIALVYEWVPKDLTPVALVKREYNEFKIMLLNRSAKPDGLGTISKITLNIVMNIESHIIKAEAEETAEAAAKAKCDENSIVRWFMTSGTSEAERAECIKNYMQQHQLEPAGN